ncbi:Hypothetical predicted protein [Mytilus galloprovincialis]|uniref:Uncharacterized protein n=1 Tax=Mytilus galloprovincialis TaxID=29158 RepID=A0A8B6FJ26_MYTGA|nr:Hypothetical predicted protein [Mytilus galloprovincialis]
MNSSRYQTHAAVTGWIAVDNNYMNRSDVINISIYSTMTNIIKRIVAAIKQIQKLNDDNSRFQTEAELIGCMPGDVNQ